MNKVTTNLRQRICDNSAPQYGGLSCSGQTAEASLCHLDVQVTYSVHHVLVSHRFNTYIYHSMLSIVHGGWSGCTDVSDCPKPCNGSQYFRTRLCNDPPPNHGGLPCDGDYLEYQPCNTHRCPGDCTVMSISHIRLNSGNILL